MTPVRHALALLCLEAAWLGAYDAWWERQPLTLGICLALGWTPLVAAWLVTLKVSWRGAVALAVALVAADALIELWNPHKPRFFFPTWQAARAVAFGGGCALARPWLRDRPAGRAAGAVLRGLSAGFALTLVATLIALPLLGGRADLGSADAALVLGFELDPAGRPHPELVARVERAVDLYRAKRVHLLVMTGGARRAGRTEAAVMRELAVAAGVPPAAILLEELSSTSEENFACAAPLLRARQIGRVLLVAGRAQSLRAQRIAARYGISVGRAPAGASPGARQASYEYLRGALAYVKELLAGPFRGPGRCPQAS